MKIKWSCLADDQKTGSNLVAVWWKSVNWKVTFVEVWTVVKTLERQHTQLTVLFGKVVMKARTETELIADCHGGTEVNLVTALGFYSMFSSLESLLNLEQRNEMVTAISVEVFPGVLQTEQKHIGKWREMIEAEMNIRHSETYCRPSGARYLEGSTLAPMCKSRYPMHFVAVDVKSTRTIVDQPPQCQSVLD